MNENDKIITIELTETEVYRIIGILSDRLGTYISSSFAEGIREVLKKLNNQVK
jgi:hypothetical protein